jgi:SAM-dependent methyltransferase
VTEFKDLFSSNSAEYVKFRPAYPDSLFRYLASLVDHHEMAWDCGTGNGQAAVQLAHYFSRILATDPSEKQLSQAVAHPKVTYRLGIAENSCLPEHSVDLVTSAQAFHWFNHANFFHEVTRVLKPGGVLGVWCYGLVEITPEVDAWVYRLYNDILGSYWEGERRLVETGYKTIGFPFQELNAPPFEIKTEWSLEHFVGYLRTWSALQTFIQTQKYNPLEVHFSELRTIWGNVPVRSVKWSLSLRVGQTAR